MGWEPGLQVPSQPLPVETSCADFGSPTPNLLLPQKGPKLTLGPDGAGGVPRPALLRPAVAGCCPGERKPAGMPGGGRCFWRGLVPGRSWSRPRLGTSGLNEWPLLGLGLNSWTDKAEGEEMSSGDISHPQMGFYFWCAYNDLKSTFITTNRVMEKKRGVESFSDFQTDGRECRVKFLWLQPPPLLSHLAASSRAIQDLVPGMPRGRSVHSCLG